MKSNEIEETRGTIGPIAIRALAVGAQSIGAIAVGAVALSAVAIGFIAIGRLVIGRAKIKRLEIGELGRPVARDGLDKRHAATTVWCAYLRSKLDSGLVVLQNLV